MTARTLRLAVAVVGLGTPASGCAGERGTPRPTTHTVEIRDMGFHPATLRVNPGDTVVWVNRDYVPHTATAPDSTWTSPPLAQDERWATVFDAGRSGPYLCAFHPVMEARVIVESSTLGREAP